MRNSWIVFLCLTCSALSSSTTFAQLESSSHTVADIASTSRKSTDVDLSEQESHEKYIDGQEAEPGFVGPPRPMTDPVGIGESLQKQGSVPQGALQHGAPPNVGEVVANESFWSAATFSPVLVSLGGFAVTGFAVLVAAAATGFLHPESPLPGSFESTSGYDGLLSFVFVLFGGAAVFFAAIGGPGAAVAGVGAAATSIFATGDFRQMVLTFLGSLPGVAIGVVATVVGSTSVVLRELAHLEDIQNGRFGRPVGVYDYVILSTVLAGLASPVVAGVGAGAANYFSKAGKE